MVKSAFEIIDWIQLNTFHRGCKLMFMAHENVDTQYERGDALMTPSFNEIMLHRWGQVKRNIDKKGQFK